MDTAATNDNFFIEEPSKLGNNFFSKDKSIQIVEILAKKHNERIGRLSEVHKNQKPMYQTRRSLRLQQSLHQVHQLKDHEEPIKEPQMTTTVMPRLLIDRLEFLCKACMNAEHGSDFDLAKNAVDSLVNASKSGCCFLEKYIVILVNFFAAKYSIFNSSESDKGVKNKETEATKKKLIRLFKKLLTVKFDRHQMTESLRRPDYKISSIINIIELLRHIQKTLDYRDNQAIDWISVIIDAYFVELATSDIAVDAINLVSSHIDSECALLREAEGTKSLIRSILDYMNEKVGTNDNINTISNYYTVQEIEL